MINEPNTPSLSRLTVQDSGTTLRGQTGILVQLYREVQKEG